jgi:hypothetical protein
MASFEERIYELGTAALADQERQVAEVRGRGSTLLAAGALIASLLAKPVFQDGHPRGVVEVTTTAAGLLGTGGVLLFVVLLMRPIFARLQYQSRCHLPRSVGPGHT